MFQLLFSSHTHVRTENVPFDPWFIMFGSVPFFIIFVECHDYLIYTTSAAADAAAAIDFPFLQDIYINIYVLEGLLPLSAPHTTLLFVHAACCCPTETRKFAADNPSINRRTDGKLNFSSCQNHVSNSQ